MHNIFLLNSKIKESGLKKNYIASRLGLTSTGFKRKQDGLSDFKASEIKEISVVLKLTSEERDRIFFSEEAN